MQVWGEVMETIVISDAALANRSYEKSMNNICELKSMQEEGYKIVFLTDGNENMKKFFGKYSLTKFLIEKNNNNSMNKDASFDISLIEGRNKISEIRFNPDYTMLINGAKILNRKGEIVSQSSCMDENTIDSIINSLHSVTFVDPWDTIESDQETYRFLTMKNDTIDKLSDIYAVKCDKRSLVLDNVAIEFVQKDNPSIKGYVTDEGPIFYKKEINRLNAIKQLLTHDDSINLDDIVFILNDETDRVIMNKYPEKCICMNEDLNVSVKVKKSNSLSDTLKQIHK